MITDLISRILSPEFVQNGNLEESNEVVFEAGVKRLTFDLEGQCFYSDNAGLVIELVAKLNGCISDGYFECKNGKGIWIRHISMGI
jgi:hypothetical protein